MKINLDQVIWSKATASSPDGPNCVEVGVYKKAEASGPNGNCIEIAGAEQGGVLLRDSKNPDAAPFWFSPGEWTAFLDGARKGEFDL